MSDRDLNPLSIFLLSGGTGRTAESVLTAALAQFEQPHVDLQLRSRVHTVGKAIQVVQEAAERNGVVCHTLVDPAIREAVAQEAERLEVPALDLLGPVLALLDDHLEVPPHNKPGLLYELHKERFDRIEAVDFTLAHDDGQRLHELDKADVVLVGVSRVAKSVTCFYVAYRGIRAANVPIILHHELPPEVTGLDPAKVIGLTMNPQRLTNVRETRLNTMGENAASIPYATVRHVAEELRYATSLMTRHGWRCVDVSYKSVEEVAREILRLIGH